MNQNLKTSLWPKSAEVHLHMSDLDKLPENEKEIINKAKTSLQDLIYRLQDAEKGYMEIRKASSNPIVNRWMDKYAAERHEMHTVLEGYIKDLGGKPEVETTFLGALHRMFIDIKISNVNSTSEVESIITEIDRGASVILDDYENIISNVILPKHIHETLCKQREKINNELNTLLSLKGELGSRD